MKKLIKIISLLFVICSIAISFAACNKNAAHDKIAADYAQLHNIDKSAVDFNCYGEFGGTHVIIFRAVYPQALSSETVDGVTFQHFEIKTFDVYNNGNFYSLQEAFDNGLLTHNNLITLRNNYNPTEQGAFDIEVGVIYRVIDLQEMENYDEEKIAIADKTTILEYLENNFGDCKYVYIYDSENLAERYSFDLNESDSGEFTYTDTVTMGKGKLLLMYHIYQEYNSSYYITSPSMGEYVDTGNSMSIQLTFGLWHTYNLKLSVIS